EAVVALRPQQLLRGKPCERLDDELFARPNVVEDRFAEDEVTAVDPVIDGARFAQRVDEAVVFRLDVVIAQRWTHAQESGMRPRREELLRVREEIEIRELIAV